MSPRPPIHRHAGFAFRGTLVPLALVATLGGLGLAVTTNIRSNRVSSASETTVSKVKAHVDSWKLEFHEHPPMRLDATK